MLAFRLLFVLTLFGASLCFGAEAYPSRLIRIVVPFGPTGSVDFVARIVGRKLSAALGQSVIIENRPGAGGNIGMGFVAKALADGYTLMIMANAFTINPSLYRKVPYDPIKDFEPISSLTSYMMFLAVNPSLPVRSVKALIAKVSIRRPARPKNSLPSSGLNLRSGPGCSRLQASSMNKASTRST